MICGNCKHYKEWGGGTEYGNSCELLGFEYFHTFYEKDCPYINDEYELTIEGKEVEKIL